MGDVRAYIPLFIENQEINYNKAKDLFLVEKKHLENSNRNKAAKKIDLDKEDSEYFRNQDSFRNSNNNSSKVDINSQLPEFANFNKDNKYNTVSHDEVASNSLTSSLIISKDVFGLDNTIDQSKIKQNTNNNTSNVNLDSNRVVNFGNLLSKQEDSNKLSNLAFKSNSNAYEALLKEKNKSNLNSPIILSKDKEKDNELLRIYPRERVNQEPSQNNPSTHSNNLIPSQSSKLKLDQNLIPSQSAKLKLDQNLIPLNHNKSTISTHSAKSFTNANTNINTTKNSSKIIPSINIISVESKSRANYNNLATKTAITDSSSSNNNNKIFKNDSLNVLSSSTYSTKSSKLSKGSFSIDKYDSKLKDSGSKSKSFKSNFGYNYNKSNNGTRKDSFSCKSKQKNHSNSKSLDANNIMINGNKANIVNNKPINNIKRITSITSIGIGNPGTFKRIAPFSALNKTSTSKDKNRESTNSKNKNCRTTANNIYNKYVNTNSSNRNINNNSVSKINTLKPKEGLSKNSSGNSISKQKNYSFAGSVTNKSNSKNPLFKKIVDKTSKTNNQRIIGVQVVRVSKNTPSIINNLNPVQKSYRSSSSKSNDKGNNSFSKHKVSQSYSNALRNSFASSNNKDNKTKNSENINYSNLYKDLCNKTNSNTNNINVHRYSKPNLNN